MGERTPAPPRVISVAAVEEILRRVDMDPQAKVEEMRRLLQRQRALAESASDAKP